MTLPTTPSVTTTSLFAADVHQGHARLLDAEGELRVDLAHRAVLGEMVRFRLEVGADIDEHDRPPEGGHRHGDPGAVHAGQAPHVHLGGGHARARVAGGDHGVQRFLRPAAGHAGQRHQG
jgi:hypothetical protein